MSTRARTPTDLRRSDVALGVLVAALVVGSTAAGIAEGASQPPPILAEGEVAGRRVALGATGWATRGGAVDALVTELGLGGEIVEPANADVWVATPAGVLPFPSDTVAGIRRRYDISWSWS